jgi:hypothetical protein
MLTGHAILNPIGCNSIDISTVGGSSNDGSLSSRCGIRPTLAHALVGVFATSAPTSAPQAIKMHVPASGLNTHRKHTSFGKSLHDEGTLQEDVFLQAFFTEHCKGLKDHNVHGHGVFIWMLGVEKQIDKKDDTHTFD